MVASLTSPSLWLSNSQTQRVISHESIDDLSGLLQRPDIPPAAIHLHLLNHVSHYWPEDHTLRVEGGITIGDLTTITQQHNQWWPTFAPPNTHLTDILASDWPPLSAGLLPPLARRYPRDTVLGLQVLQANGTLTRCGGRVMKNVAGYDLIRLYCGSYQSLGIITEATLRLETAPSKPLQGYWQPYPSWQAALTAANNARLSPIYACEVTHHQGDWGVFTISANNHSPNHAATAVDDWETLAGELFSWPVTAVSPANTTSLLAVATLPLQQVANLCHWLENHPQPMLSFHARPAAGLVFIKQSSSTTVIADTDPWWAWLAQGCATLGGHCRYIAQPQLNCHHSPPIAALHQQLKHTFDPNHRLHHPAMAWAYT